MAQTVKIIDLIESRFSIALTQPARVLSVSNDIENLLGFKKEIFLNGNISLQSLIHAHDQDIAEALFSNEVHPASGIFNIRLRHADGRIRCFKGQYKKYLNNLDKVMTLDLLLQDAKSLWQQQDNQTTMVNFKAMMDNTDDIIYFKDRNHVFTAASQTLVSFTDPSEHWSDLIGKTDYDLIPEEYADIYYSLEKQVFSGAQVAHEVQETLDKYGNKGWVDNKKYPIKNDKGEIIGLFGIARDITERIQIEKKLKESEERLAFAIMGTQDGLWDWNLLNDKVYYSPRWKSILGYEDSEIANDFSGWEKLLHPEDLKSALSNIQYFLNNKAANYTSEFRMQHKDGHYIDILSRAFAVEDVAGKVTRLVGTHVDITERKLAEQALSKEKAIAYEALKSLESQKRALDEHSIVATTDVRGRITYVNEKFCAISGYSQDELLGKNHRIINSGHHPKEFFKALYHTIAAGKVWHGEICNRNKNGNLYWVDTTIVPFIGGDGKPQEYIAIRNDITERKLAEEEIKSLAFNDSLTQLPNRRLLVDRLNHALAASARSGQRGALLFMDLDHFKILNDTLGHDVGDELLKQVAARLTANVREGDTVSRLGGDEFVILLEGLSKEKIEATAQAKDVAEKILRALNQAYQFNNQLHHSTATIGAKLFIGHKQPCEELLKQADIAMYQSKTQGRNTIRFFDPKMQEEISNRVDLERELRIAIEQKQFELHYQTQVSSAGRPVGAEALIRWQHPERGTISPFNFIPLAEETGLILPIGQWVIDSACAQLKIWEQNPLTRDLLLAVNVSAKQFFQSDFVEHVLASITRHDINPSHLKLELTESMLVDNINDIIGKMNVLSKIGIRFSLDDFGTGYSSLQYLKKLPLNQLKIDQSFVRDITTDSSDRAIVRTIVNMAHSLRIDVIAEGVETEEQRKFLLDNGCLHYQGYLFSKPLPIDEFEALLIKN